VSASDLSIDAVSATVSSLSTQARYAADEARLPSAGAVASPESMRAIGRDFEAMFVGRMLDSMFQGVSTGGTFGGGQAEQTWRSFMLQEYGKAVAEQGSLGIGRMVEAEVARLYAQQSEGAAE